MPRAGNSSPTEALKAWALYIFATLADAACMIFGPVHCTLVVAADPGKPVGRGCKEECTCTVYRVTAQTFVAAQYSLGLQARPCSVSELKSCADAVFDAVREATNAEKSRQRRLVVAAANFDCLDFVVKAAEVRWAWIVKPYRKCAAPWTAFGVQQQMLVVRPSHGPQSSCPWCVLACWVCHQDEPHRGAVMSLIDVFVGTARAVSFVAASRCFHSVTAQYRLPGATWIWSQVVSDSCDLENLETLRARHEGFEVVDGSPHPVGRAGPSNILGCAVGPLGSNLQNSDGSMCQCRAVQVTCNERTCQYALATSH
jgi:hypothetical protein